MQGLARRCPYCGSTRLAWDHERGYLVCMDCGAIIEPLIDEGNDWEEAPPRPGGAGIQWRPHLHDPEWREGSLPVITYRRTYKPTVSSMQLRGEPRTGDCCYPTSRYQREFCSVLDDIHASRRIKAALIRYLLLKIIGTRDRDAIIIAARECGVSKRYLEKTIRLLRNDLREALERLGEEIAKRHGSHVGSLRDSQEVTRPNL